MPQANTSKTRAFRLDPHTVTSGPDRYSRRTGSRMRTPDHAPFRLTTREEI